MYLYQNKTTCKLNEKQHNDITINCKFTVFWCKSLFFFTCHTWYKFSCVLFKEVFQLIKQMKTHIGFQPHFIHC